MKFLKNYSLSLVLLCLFLASWASQGYFQWQEFSSHQEQHGASAETSEFVSEFMSATFENWQSEFLQLLSMVVLTSFLIHKGSAESRDSSDEIQLALARIEKLLKNKK